MLLEARIPPSSKRALRYVIEKTARKYHLKSHQHHRVPHMTLYGPFTTNKNTKKPLISEIENVCCKYEPVYLYLDGFEAIEKPNANIIYFKPHSLNQLGKLRKELRDSLAQFVNSNQEWDRKNSLEWIFGDNYIYHVTLAYNLSDTKFRAMWREFENNDFNRYINLQRITLLSNKSRIIVEYDLKEKKLLTREEALRKKHW